MVVKVINILFYEKIVVSNPNPNSKKLMYKAFLELDFRLFSLNYFCKYCINSVSYTKIYEIIRHFEM